VVVHELGHEYFGVDYARAAEDHDHAPIRELERGCDRHRRTDLRRLGLNPDS
jgi:hypothetical protein